MLLLPALLLAAAAMPDLTVPMALTTPTGPGAAIGVVTAHQGPAGVVFALNLKGLPPGPHGFHVHMTPSCAPAIAADGKTTPAGGAGGHLDPDKTGVHMGPAGMGHLGDLPLITVDADGTSRQTLDAPRIATLDTLKGHALMIHAGGDNYADTPAPLGGGGARLACGIVPGS